MYKKKIGNNIKKYRLAAGYSQSDLGELLNTTKQNISSWEKDRTHPDNKTIEKMANILGCNFDDLMKDCDTIQNYIEHTSPSENDIIDFYYQNKEMELVAHKYIEASDDIKNAICKLLDIDRTYFLSKRGIN